MDGNSIAQGHEARIIALLNSCSRDERDDLLEMLELFLELDDEDRNLMLRLIHRLSRNYEKESAA